MGLAVGTVATFALSKRSMAIFVSDRFARRLSCRSRPSRPNSVTALMQRTASDQADLQSHAIVLSHNMLVSATKHPIQTCSHENRAGEAGAPLMWTARPWQVRGPALQSSTSNFNRLVFSLQSFPFHYTEAPRSCIQPLHNVDADSPTTRSSTPRQHLQRGPEQQLGLS